MSHRFTLVLALVAVCSSFASAQSLNPSWIYSSFLGGTGADTIAAQTTARTPRRMRLCNSPIMRRRVVTGISRPCVELLARNTSIASIPAPRLEDSRHLVG